MHIEKVDLADDLMVKGDFDDLVEVVNEESTFEILILAILWVVFLVEDLADDEEKKAHKEEKTSKLPLI